MGQHSFRPGAVGLELKPVRLWAIISIGASGAPTISRAKGVTSVVRNSAGKYTLTLDRPYNTLLGLETKVSTPTTGIATAPVIGIVSQAVNNATPTIVLQCSAATNSSTTTLVATDPASGETLYLAIDLSDSTA